MKEDVAPKHFLDTPQRLDDLIDEAIIQMQKNHFEEDDVSGIISYGDHNGDHKCDLLFVCQNYVSQLSRIPYTTSVCLDQLE